MADLTAADVVVSQVELSLTSGFRMALVDLTPTNGTDDYPTGGIPLPAAADLGFPHGYAFACVEPSTNGYVYFVDRTNNKLLIYIGDYNNASDGPLIAFAGTPAAVTLRVLFIGI